MRSIQLSNWVRRLEDDYAQEVWIYRHEGGIEITWDEGATWNLEEATSLARLLQEAVSQAQHWMEEK